MKYKDYIILIPARLGSTRLKKKAMIKINSKSLINHVIDSAKRANLGIPIVVATDSKQILNEVKKNGGEAILTSKKHQSGSDRIHEALNLLDPLKKFKKIIHLQGDLPNVSSELIKNLANIVKNENCIATPVVKATEEEFLDENIVKCVASFNHSFPKTNDIGNALYFSRLPIPWGKSPKWHHLGIYAWDRNVLNKYIKLKPSNLEKSEKLEQLRALEAGIDIKILITNHRPIGIDTCEDLEKFKISLKNKNDNKFR